jgi:hypothetical protein
MGERGMLNSAEGLESPPFIHNLIHRSDQLSTGQGVGVTAASGKRVPHVVELCGGMYYVPSTNISTKVKLQYGSEQGFYSM